MKKFLSLLCALLLLTVSCASADGTVVEFHDKILLNGALPEGCSYSQISLDENMLFGNISSGDPAAPYYEICINLSDNTGYIEAESPKDLGTEELNLIKQRFEDESNVTFDMLVTASGDNLLVVREITGQFLDFYTVCLGYEIDLTLLHKDGKALTDAEINSFLEFIRNMDIVPVKG